MSNKNKQREAQLQVLKGLRDLKKYIEDLEKFIDTPVEHDEHSVSIGKAAINHSIKGLVNEINK